MQEFEGFADQAHQQNNNNNKRVRTEIKRVWVIQLGFLF